ncbi:aldose 1-epimerase [Acrasis kona]|uniref:Aldose 1-epimerase n=1 Tax=Acrasis kona TaxID=1008807 RepID=A0AAW2Z4M4_9EUKA
MLLDPSPFGTVDGRLVYLYTLTNEVGNVVKITDYGGIIVSLLVKDSKGDLGDVVLGFDSVDGYVQNSGPYLGALIGRYANRIKNGEFSLDDKKYSVPVNNGPNSLHGGIKGFDKKIWQVKVINNQTIELYYHSKDGEEGYPGTLDVKVTYTLSKESPTFTIDYVATTDSKTVLNLTNHTYFNLSAGQSSDILDHKIQLNAKRYTPVDATSIPLGQLADVKGTDFDFTDLTRIGDRIDNVDSGGYDHNFEIQNQDGKLAQCAKVVDPKSGRILNVRTTQPGVQFYAGNYLNGEDGKNSTKYVKRYGFCLETQHFPDSPNQPHFPPATLSQGEQYHHTTVFDFSNE